MKTTCREFITTLKNGREMKIVATYVSELTVDPMVCNYPNMPRDYVSHYGSVMVAYIDGVKIQHTSTDPSFWRLIDTNGIKKIWGMPIGFEDPEKINAYNAFLVDLMQEDDEVIAFKQAAKRKKTEEELKYYRQVVAQCNAGWMVETEEEVKKKRKQWNDLHNEGGDGYVPTWYTRAQYEYAIEYIAANET